MNPMFLSELKKGQKAIVKGYTDSFHSVCRLCDVGLLPGTMVELKSQIPFGGPLCVCLDKNRCKLAIGKKEAASILISLV